MIIDCVCLGTLYIDVGGAADRGSQRPGGSQDGQVVEDLDRPWNLTKRSQKHEKRKAYRLPVRGLFL